MKKAILIFLLSSFLSPLFAATGNLWTAQKIHIVLGVLLIILTGIIIFMVVLESKISKLEKKIQKN